MIDIKEEEIISKWNYDLPMVSIIAKAYNHGKFIANTLDNMLSQKTSFPFEILVNDDCSKDNTQEIIKEYEKRYPNIIHAVYQYENQTSKGIDVRSDILYPLAKGKYVALCECDDYWNDANKLQTQYDFMESHNDYAMCVHNTIKHDLLTNEETLFTNKKEDFDLNEKDIFFNWKVHTSSYFMIKEIAFTPKDLRYWFGDYTMLTLAYSKGKIRYIAKTMSVYSYNNVSGETYNLLKSLDSLIKKEELRDEYLIKYNKYTNNKFSKIVNDRLAYDEIYLSKLRYNIDHSINNFNHLKEVIKKNKNGMKYFNLNDRFMINILAMNKLMYKIYSKKEVR